MNWGTKLVIGMVVFMIFIMALGAIMIIRSGDDALIETNYYEKGQFFDRDYKAKKDAIDDQILPAVATTDGVTITFPVAVNYKLICKRPSDSRMDKNFSGTTDNNRSIKIPKGDLQSGPWLFRIEYSAGNKNYLFEGEITMP